MFVFGAVVVIVVSEKMRCALGKVVDLEFERKRLLFEFHKIKDLMIFTSSIVHFRVDSKKVHFAFVWHNSYCRKQALQVLVEIVQASSVGEVLGAIALVKNLLGCFNVYSTSIPFDRERERERGKREP